MPASKYSCLNLEFYDSSHPLNSSSPLATDVLGGFNRLPTTGDFLGVWENDLFPRKRYSTEGGTGLGNHFQGIQRIQDSNYFVLSGGDEGENQGHLFIARLDSREPESAWRSNILFDEKPPDTDNVISVICVKDRVHALPDGLWHVGGLDSSGDVLAAPVEGSRGSMVLFYNFHDPEKPKLFPQTCWIDRPRMKAGAVSITRLRNGRTLVGVLGKHDDMPDTTKEKPLFFDLYVSRSTDWTDGFDLGESERVDGNILDCQALNFIRDTSDRLYLVGFRNTRQTAPDINGDDMGYLFEVKLNPGNPDDIAPGRCAIQSIRKIAEKNFVSRKVGRKTSKYSQYYFNMNAGSGIYVHPRGALFAHSCFHWSMKKVIRLCEFRPDPRTFSLDLVNALNDAWIDFYENDHFSGRFFGIVGRRDARIPDFAQVSVQAKAFGKSVSSIRFQIPVGKALRLYRHQDFVSRDNDHFDLVGTGRVEEHADLKDVGFGDKTRSCQFVDRAMV